MKIERLERPDYLDRFASHYELGEHLYACEPTQQGKSHLLHQMVGRILPDLNEVRGFRFVSLVPKPRDPATAFWAPQLGLKVVDRWPPPGHFPGQRPAGYALWPKHLQNADPKDNWAHLAAVMRPALHDQFWKGNTLTLADDAHTAAVRLDLNGQFEQHLTDGGGMQAALWLSNQKPSGSVATGSLTSFAYSQPTHFVFGHDTDGRNVRRMAEFSGVDPDMVAWTVERLPIHRIATSQGIKNISEKVYIHKGGPWMCVIKP